MLNKIKTDPFAFVIWIMLSCAVHIVLFRTKVNMDYEIWQRILTVLLAICFVLPIHELIHFVFMKMFHKGSVKIKIMKDPMGLPTLGTVTDGKFQKWQIVIIYLAPFVFLTLLTDAVFLFCDRIELIFFIVSVCNCAGCLYDIIDTLITVTKKDNGNTWN